MASTSRNVLICKLVRCSQAFAQGLWNNGVLSPFLFLLTHDSKTVEKYGLEVFADVARAVQKVGLVQGLAGLATVCMALPVGFFSDKTQRHYIARFSAALDACAIATCSAAILFGGSFTFDLLGVAAVLWGMSAACDSSMDALFADSIPTGRRAEQFTQMLSLSRAFLGCGPLLAAVVFHLSGNAWDLNALATVILCGMVAALVPMALKLALHDSHSLGAEAEALTVGGAPPREKAAHGGRDAPQSADGVAVASESDRSSSPAPVDVAAGVGGSAASLRCESADAAGGGASDMQDAPSDVSALTEPLLPLSGSARTQPASECCECPEGPSVSRLAFWVPFLISLSDVLGGLAAGMTIKFFPIFFMDEVRLTPVQSSFLFASMPVCIALGMVAAQRTARATGRVPAVFLYKWAAVALLALMAWDARLWRVKALIVPIYLLRTCAANCTRALSRSILMDFVPKSLRGRWSCVDGITAFGWSGSALLGGYLVDRTGFAPVFLLTAALQFVATLVTLPLLAWVPLHEAPVDTCCSPLSEGPLGAACSRGTPCPCPSRGRRSWESAGSDVVGSFGVDEDWGTAAPPLLGVDARPASLDSIR